VAARKTTGVNRNCQCKGGGSILTLKSEPLERLELAEDKLKIGANRGEKNLQRAYETAAIAFDLSTSAENYATRKDRNATERDEQEYKLSTRVLEKPRYIARDEGHRSC